jgi:hypothetical protein
MKLTQSQIKSVRASKIGVSGLSATGGSQVVTTEVSTALSTAGASGVSVPVQVSSDVVSVGIIVASPNNLCEIFDATTKQKLIDLEGNEVYGRLTHNTGVYTLTYYVLDAGVETAYTLPATDIDFLFSYRFSFDTFPPDSLISVPSKYIYQDPSGASGGSVYQEIVTITALNTLGDLTKTPISGTSVTLSVNGKDEHEIGSSPAFSRVGKVLTWNASNAYPINSTEYEVIAYYSTNE